MYKNGQANAFGALLDFIPNVVQAGVAIWAGKRLEKKRKGKGKKY